MSMASWRKTNCCALLTAILIAGLPASYLCADQPVASTSVAPNQSISLTDDKPDPVLTVGAGESSIDPSLTDPGTHTDGGEPRKTTLMRRRGSGDSISNPSSVSGLSVPWYRSGLVSLGVVLGVIGVVYWLTRRLVPTFGASDNAVVRVVARSALSPKHNVVLLRVGRRFVLVGLSGERMTTLSDITDADEVSDLVSTTGMGKPSSRGTFEKLMERESDAFEDLPVESTEPDDDPMVPSRRVGFQGTALSQLKDRLRGLQQK